MKKIFNFCNPYLMRQQGKLYCYITVSIVLGLLAFVTPLVTGCFIDELTDRNSDSAAFIWKYAVILLGVGVVQFIFGYVKERLYTLIQMKCAIDINTDAIHHVQTASTKIAKDTAYLNDQLNADSNFITMFCMNTLQDIVVNTITVLIPLVIVFFIEPWLVLLLLLLDVVYLNTYHLLKKKMYERSLELKISQSEFFSRLDEQLFNIRFIQLHGIAANFITRLKTSAEDVLKKALRLQDVEYGFKGNDTIVVTVTMCLALSLGGMTVVNGRITVGEMTIVISLLTMSMGAAGFFFNLGQDVQENAASKERLEKVFAEKTQPNGKEMPSSIDTICCEGLSFSYAHQAIVTNRTYRFEKGKCYALVGENGAGKSTIVDLLLGLYAGEYQGKITYNGISIEQLDMYNIRKKLVGVSEQEPLLLPETMEYNLTLDDNAVVSDTELQKYAEMLGMKKFLSGLRDGLQTTVNEKSSNVSGGEKQKLSLMRVLLKNPDVLVLDEPTSAMDKESTEQFCSFLKEYGKNHIILIVTHDKEMLAACDEVIELKKELQE